MSSPFGGSGTGEPDREEPFGSEPAQYGPRADPTEGSGSPYGPSSSQPQPYYGGQNYAGQNYGGQTGDPFHLGSGPPGYGRPYGHPGYGPPPFGQPGYGQLYGQPSGQSGYGQPGYGPLYGRPHDGYGQQPPRKTRALPWILGGVGLVVVLVVVVVLVLTVGSRGPLTGASSRSQAIPDANPAGVTDVINLDGSGSVSAIQVGVTVTHPYTCDLVVTLRSPQGAVATLADSNDCSRNRPGLALQLDSRQAGSSLAPLVGQAAGGPWTLQVVDNTLIDRGTLDSWNITVER